MENKAINERNRRKSKSKRSHQNQYYGASKSTRTKISLLTITFYGSEGTAIVYNLHKTLKIVKTCVTYTGQKLNSRFQITDKINEKHKHDLIYYTKSSETSCNENYPGETGYRIIERVADYDGKHKKSHLMKHALTQNH